MRSVAVLFSLLLTVPAAAQAPAPAPAAAEIYSVTAGQSSLTYHLIHKLHKVDGVSKKVEGKAQLTPGGQVKVMVRAPVESFDSGDNNRDTHMKETVEAARHPTVELKAVGEGVTPPASYPATVKKTFKAQLLFHGVTKTMDIPVDITFESATRIKASSSFSISLDGFSVERPSLLFVKVNDDLKIDAAVTFTK